MNPASRPEPSKPDDELDSILKDIESYHYELWDGHLESAKKRLLAWRERQVAEAIENHIKFQEALKPEPLKKEDV